MFVGSWGAGAWRGGRTGGPAAKVGGKGAGKRGRLGGRLSLFRNGGPAVQGGGRRGPSHYTHHPSLFTSLVSPFRTVSLRPPLARPRLTCSTPQPRLPTLSSVYLPHLLCLPTPHRRRLPLLPPSPQLKLGQLDRGAVALSDGEAGLAGRVVRREAHREVEQVAVEGEEEVVEAH